MNELSKAVRRREGADPTYKDVYFVGDGIDVGCARDGLSQYRREYPLMRTIREWDLPDGDAQHLMTIPSNSLDFLHSSHCLEHLESPFVGLQNWIRVVKPGGYLIIVLPDEQMYEHGLWPSRFSGEHLWSFRVGGKSTLPKSVDCLLMIQGEENVRLERLIMLRKDYDPMNPNDQTLGSAECAIEIILKKQ